MTTKGTENGRVSLPKLYETTVAGARKAFPNIGQQTVTPDDIEHYSGVGARGLKQKSMVKVAKDRMVANTFCVREKGGGCQGHSKAIIHAPLQLTRSRRAFSG